MWAGWELQSCGFLFPRLPAHPEAGAQAGLRACAGGTHTYRCGTGFAVGPAAGASLAHIAGGFFTSQATREAPAAGPMANPVPQR